MSIKNLIVFTALFFTFITPARAAADFVKVDKSVSNSKLENVCELTTVNLKVKGADKEVVTQKKTDIVLIMDHSYSMFQYGDGRMGESQAAATTFIDQLDPNFDKVGLVRFSTTAENQANLTDSYSPVKNIINGYHQDGFEAFTNLEDAISKGINEIDNNGRSDATKLMILFSDGGVNRPLNGGVEDKPYAKGKALDKANDAASKNIIIYTVTLGDSNTDKDLMKDIASATGGKAFVAPQPQDIVDAYLKIAQEITDSVASNIKVTDVVNEHFILVGGSDTPNANITANPDGSKTLKWNIGVLKSNQEVKFSYQITPEEKGNNQAIDSNPLSKVEYIDTNGDHQTINISTTKVSVKSDICGRGGHDDNDDEDNDDSDDDHDNNDGKGSILAAATSRMSILPVTGGFNPYNLLPAACENRRDVEVFLIFQPILQASVAALTGYKRKYQIIITLVFASAIYVMSGCPNMLFVVSLAIGLGFIAVSRLAQFIRSFNKKTPVEPAAE